MLPQETESEARDTLGTEAGLHQNPVPEKILGQVADGLAALHGGKDGSAEGVLEVGDLKVQGGDRRRVSHTVLVTRNLNETPLLFESAAGPLGLVSVCETVDTLAVKI